MNPSPSDFSGTAKAAAREPEARRLEVSTPAFVGREQELETLARALSLPPAVALVEGEAGIGKSRLVREFLASPAAADERVLAGICPPFREPYTLAPVVDAFRHACDGVTGLRLSALAGALRPLFPEWADDLPPLPEPLEDPRAARHRLFSALAELIAELEATILVVEDVHWADEATLEFLLFCAARQQAEELELSLIVTYRPEDVRAGSLLLQLSSRLPPGTSQVRIVLPPLIAADAAALVASMLGEDVSEAFAAFLHERTEGIPLALEESVWLLRSRADLLRRDETWVRRTLAELQVPPTVRDSTLERAQRLRPAAHRILRAAAVVTEPATATTLQSVAGLPEQAAAAGLAEAAESGLIVEDARGRLLFRHFLMAVAVYEAIPGPERRRLHLRAGQALEQVAPLPVAQLARHFREAGESGKWALYAEQAADHAVASGDHATAIVLLQEVVTAAGLSTPTRARLARKLASATLLRSEPVIDLHQAVIGTLRTVLETPGLASAEQGELRQLLGRLLIQLGDYDAAHLELEAAIPELEHDPAAAARAMMLLARPYGSPWPASVHLEWCRRAANVDLSSASAADRLGLIGDRATALLQLGEEEGWRVASELPLEANTPDERNEITRGCLNIGNQALGWGRYAEARRRLAVASQLAEADCQLRLRPKILLNQADLDWRTGAWSGLPERLAALADDAELSPGIRVGVIQVSGWLHAAQGAGREAERQFLFVLDEVRRLGVWDWDHPAADLARLRLAEGRPADAVRVTDEPVKVLTSREVWVWATEIVPIRVEALIALGRFDDAAALESMHARGLRGRRIPAARTALMLCRALLARGRGDHARAAALFKRAAAAWDRLPQPYDALLARERQADCLLAAGEAEPGLALLSQVFERLLDLGAGGDADRVARKLREHGLETRRPWRGGRRGYGEELSPRELEVVRLVVAGKTNREIAETLSKSPKTVGAQVQSAMRKLGVSSRTALAVASIEAASVAEAEGDSLEGLIPRAKD